MSRADAVDTIASKRPIVIGFSVGDAMAMAEGAIGGTPGGGAGMAVGHGGVAEGGELADDLPTSASPAAPSTRIPM